MNRKLRNILLGLGVVIIAGLTCLLINEINITRHYNKGNKSYNNHYYVGAISQYESAAKGFFLGKRDCDIHVNKALSLCRKYKIIGQDMTQLTNDEIEETLDNIEEIKAYLVENGCAGENDSGHDEDAQQLYDDLCDYENQLQDQEDQNNQQQNQGNAGGSGSSGDSSDNQDSNGQSNDNQDQSGQDQNDQDDSGQNDQDDQDSNDQNNDNSQDDQDQDGQDQNQDQSDSDDDLEDLYAQEQQEGNNERQDDLGDDGSGSGYSHYGNNW